MKIEVKEVYRGIFFRNSIYQGPKKRTGLREKVKCSVISTEASANLIGAHPNWDETLATYRIKALYFVPHPN